jgi:hypothetical protein
MTKYERRLLSKGTDTGPVDPVMIEYAKMQCNNSCKNLNAPPNKDEWGHWIPFARTWFLNECPTGCVKPFQEEWASWGKTNLRCGICGNKILMYGVYCDCDVLGDPENDAWHSSQIRCPPEGVVFIFQEECANV